MGRNTDQSMQELLEIYMNMVEKQDEIIFRMSEMLRECTREIQHLKNLNEYFAEDDRMAHDRAVLRECVEQYNEMKGTE
jgi:hypothetical protein